MRQALFGHRGRRAPTSARPRALAILGGQALGLRLSARRLSAAAALAFGLVSAGLAEAQTLASLPNAKPIENTGTARPVLGWVKFCERHPDECRVNVAEAAVVTMTPQVWRTIVLVNRRVNARIKPMTDKEHWGIVDSWNLPDDGYGDCEDYQLLKRRNLAEQGLPRRAMRMTVVIDDQGEGHAVLMIRTDRGDFILDNKTNAVLPWNQTGYVFVKREGQDDAAWASLGGIGSPVTTANR